MDRARGVEPRRGLRPRHAFGRRNGIYFANADRDFDRILELVDSAPGTKVLVFDGRPLEMARAAVGGRSGGRYFPQLRDAVEAFTTRTG